MSRKIDINKPLHVVILVLENSQGDILVTKRANDKHLGGFWEFPGGKVEQGESRLAALKREMLEEIDYSFEHATPLTCFTYSFASKTIKLDVWYRKKMNPQVKANESQPLKWVQKTDLYALNMPDSNTQIIDEILKR